MDRSDKLLLAVNLLLIAFAGLGFGSADIDVLQVAALLAIAVAVANVAAVSLRREPAPARRERRNTKADELDAAAILDLDARLEALEQAQADATDAARWRALVESGQVTGPAAESTVERPGPARNGRAAS